ncbi:DUF3618 domain-containing protein [Loktanella salsilacus]|uniref:DUF3618 domain-containing protein n=1 Tax=Loktanella salsilacus TaxID=195913 RepID=UPI0020B7B9E5|nr:DUF3618 domain-containing protein [Loktanella salsilacus]UTH47878.1 DUF3618 domain-containing protein [Loktanella salsilacus]
MTADTRKPAEIEAEIALERARLGRDLDVLQNRLTVDGLMEEVKLQVRGQIDEVTAQLRGQVGIVTRDVSVVMRDQIATASETVSRTAQKNPWPFAVIGLGLAWLAISAVTPERAPRSKKPRIGMAPVKPATRPEVHHYDSSPADMAAAQLEEDADVWADQALSAQARPVPAYDSDPLWARDDQDPNPRRR